MTLKSLEGDENAFPVKKKTEKKEKNSRTHSEC